MNETINKLVKHLEISRERMQLQYNISVRFFNYKICDKVWVEKKTLKTGENKKLAPRTIGPWSIIGKCVNGVNYEISNDDDKSKKTVHHNRLHPVCRSQRRYKEMKLQLMICKVRILMTSHHLKTKLQINQ